MGRHKSKPRVLIDTFHLYEALTGVRTYTTQLLRGIESTDNLSAEYIAFPDWRKAEASTYFKGRLGFIRKIIRHGCYFLHKQLILPIYCRWKKIDVLLAPDFVLPYMKGAEVNLAVVHDVFFWEMKSNYPKLWRSYFTRMIELGLGKSDLIISTSDYTSGNIRKFVTDKIDIEVVYQCAKPLLATEEGVSVLKEMQLESRGFFLHVGLIDKRKNLLTLVKAFALFLDENPEYNYKLVLAGQRAIGQNQDIYDELMVLIRSYALDKKVLLSGFIEDSKLSTLYKHANAYILPSYDEGFGIPVLEAFQSEIPLVISDRGALEEVSGGAALIFKADDANGLAGKMRQLQNNDVRQDLIDRGKERLRKFSRSAFVSRMDKLIFQHWTERNS